MLPKIYTYMKVLWLKSPDNWRNRAWDWVHKIELLAKGTTNNPGCINDYRLLSINRWQGPIAENNTHKNHQTLKWWAVCYTEPSSLLYSIFAIASLALYTLPKEKTKSKLSIKPVIYHGILTVCKTWQCNDGKRFVGVTNHHLIWLNASSMSWNLYLMLFVWPRTLECTA